MKRRINENYYNTKDVLELVSNRTRSKLNKIINDQKNKYGNDMEIEVIVSSPYKAHLNYGEGGADFIKTRSGEWEHDYGYIKISKALANDILNDVCAAVGLNESYKRRIRESMDDYDVNAIAKWIERTIRWLVSEDCGMGTYDLGRGLAICVGWSGGYDKNDETVIHSTSDPSWVIVAGIKVPSSDYMSTDFDFVNFPYFDNGDIWDTMISIEPNEDYKYLAKYLLEEYYDIVKYLDEHNCYIEDDGEIVPYGDEEYEEEDWD